MALNRIFYPTLESTNIKARELAREQTRDEGIIVQAGEQTKGKGYGSNTWESEAGRNITATWIFQPAFLHPSRQFLLTMAFSLAVRETVEYFSGNAQIISIKWPNDIYAGNKKIAGILVENNIMGETIRECFAGIGLNVNQTRFLSDAPNPVSLAQLTGKEILTEHCLEILDMHITQWYGKLKMTQTFPLKQAYHNYLYRREQWADFESNGTTFRGKIETTDTWGRLVIRKEDNRLHSFDFKEVSFLI